MSSDTQKRKKPNKKKRVVDQPVSTSSLEKTNQNINASDASDAKQRLRERIRSMQKDRGKGSYACEENANHSY
jgi:stalled ribosome alternative rescue factor ArfA